MVISMPNRNSTACGVSHFIAHPLEQVRPHVGARTPWMNPGAHETPLMIFMSRGSPWSRHRRRGVARPWYHGRMKLRTRLNLVISALSAAFVAALIAAEIQSTRESVREEIEAANRVASQLLGQLASVYSAIGGPDLVLQFVHQLGRVRANEVYLLSPSGEVLYRAPAATYKAGRDAPVWFARLLTPTSAKEVFMLRGGVRLVVEAQPSRAVLDAWDDVVRICDRGRRHARRRECGRLLAGGARVQAHPHHRGRIGAPATRRSRLQAAAARRVPRRRSSATRSTAWRRRSKTRCWRSVRRATRRRGSRSAAKWPRSPTSASKRNGG